MVRLMPIYTFCNTHTGEEFEEMMSMAEREDFLQDHPHMKQMPPTQVNIVSGVRSVKHDSGFNDNLQRIADAHPTSSLANQYGSKSIKDVKTRQAVQKWRKKRSQDTRK